MTQVDNRCHRHRISRRPPRFAPIVIGALAGVVAAAAGASPFGVNAHVPSDAILHHVQACNIDWIRIDVLWSWVEPQQDAFDWTIYDRLVDAAERRGLRILATVGSTPAWATSGSPGNGVPGDPLDWWDVCFRAAHRYRGRIAAWGLWNEPNLDKFWQGTRSEYIEIILKTGAAAVHTADPGAMVCAPTTSHLSSAHWDDWLDEVIREAGASLDVVTHNVYPDGSGSSDVTDKLEDGGSLPWEDDSVKEVLKDAGWWGQPFWLTETGIESYRYGEGDQAEFYTNLLTAWFRPDRTRSWVDRIFFYEMTDDPNFPSVSFGILSEPPLLRRKMSFYAYRDFLHSAQVDDAEVVSTTLPDYTLPDIPFVADIMVRNTGTTTWSAAEGYRLTVGVDFAVWELEILDLDPAIAVPPGATATFTVTIVPPPRREPLAPKTFNFSWRMERESRWSFGDRLRDTITVGRDTPPEITLHPQTWTGPHGGTAVFAAGAASDTDLSYRWQRNGLDLADDGRFTGTTTDTLEVIDASHEVTGLYRCVITNAAGPRATDWAGLHLLSAPGDAPRLGERWPAPLTAGKAVTLPK